MVFRNPVFLVLLMLCATTLDMAFSQNAEAKGKKRVSSRTYFVPPPPAYTPSLTPAVYTNGKVEIAEKPAKKDKYKKYVYTREGYEQPKATKPNPYVTYWGS